MLFKALINMLLSLFSALFSGNSANHYTAEEWREQQDALEAYSKRRD
jgi:hypothetical protein